MVSRRSNKWWLIPVLLIAIAVVIAIIVVMRMEFNSDYSAAMDALNAREIELIMTARAQGN